MFDVKKMMQQAQQMQFRFQELQEKLKDIDVEGESGGGLVRVVMSCVGVVRSITIDPAIVVQDDKEALEDMIVAAMNNVSEKKEERVQQESQKMMGEFGMPPGTKLPF